MQDHMIRSMFSSDVMMPFCPFSLQMSRSNMYVKRRKTRRFVPISCRVTRRGTPAWTRRNQNLHRSKRNKKNSAPVRKESR